jgi:hypothetical protein
LLLDQALERRTIGVEEVAAIIITGGILMV